jgi:hypothetical protein
VKAPLFRRRTVWLPTPLGWACLVVAVLALPILWWFGGEDFLTVTDRQPPDILVVESWIGIEGVRAAGAEFLGSGYHHIVATGGKTGRYWSQQRWSLSDVAERELARLGIPPEKIILCTDDDAEEHRTFEFAAEIRRNLQSRGITPTSINVFTLGAHARRSRLVFAKVFADVPVGVIAWAPRGYRSAPWWHSSFRAEEFLKETVGYLFERCFNSGRLSNRAANPDPPAAASGG